MRCSAQGLSTYPQSLGTTWVNNPNSDEAAALPIAILLVKGFFRRLFVRYFVVEANPVPLAYLAGFLSFLVGTTWSIVLVVQAIGGATTTIEVVAASSSLLAADSDCARCGA